MAEDDSFKALNKRKQKKKKISKEQALEEEPEPGNKLPEVASTNGGEKIQIPTEVKTTIDVQVSLFDYSIENHFKAIETMSKLSGEPETPEINPVEINRLSSSITFLREWKYFNYKPKTIRFACSNGSGNEKEVIGEISLPQFSSAAIPKKKMLNGISPSPYDKDFVLYAGGPIWAMDWCPRVDQYSKCNIKIEFVAVAAHSPESSYHKIGEPLIGRGLIQIWGLLNIGSEEYVPCQVKRKRRCNRKIPTVYRKLGRPRKKPLEDVQIEDNDKKSIRPKRTRGKAKNYNENESSDNVEREEDNVKSTRSKRIKKKAKNYNEDESSDYVESEEDNEKSTRPKRTKGKAKNYNENESSEYVESEEDNAKSTKPKRKKEKSRKICEDESSPCNLLNVNVPKDVALPRIMLCLAHYGRTTWDVKWKPSSECYEKHRMGYLAVLLGNGALEVWEVPYPRTIKAIYHDCKTEGTDPRFMKLKPVFKCSKLMSGDIQSIPLTVEWSASSPHNMILAGCHDGVVAMWKFSAEDSCKDTRPLLCFSADSAPIRALAWAPAESGSEGENVIVTSGHKGMKFWDIRDPYRPLWDFGAVKEVLNSLDWLSDPRCVIVCFDDGTLRTLSLKKAAYDVSVTGQPFKGKPQQGFHSYLCCSYAIWSVNISKKTGMVAYCTVDGNALRFQLTTREVERDEFRYRGPHFLCGSFSSEEEDSILTVVTPECDTPFPMKSTMNDLCDGPRTKRGFVSVSNQKKRAKEEEAVANKKGSDNDDVDPSIGFETSGEDVEVLPSKMVAIHKVKWNMNKGSERWLSYGGASGVVRCQEVNIHNS